MKLIFIYVYICHWIFLYNWGGGGEDGIKHFWHRPGIN